MKLLSFKIRDPVRLIKIIKWVYNGEINSCLERQLENIRNGEVRVQKNTNGDWKILVQYNNDNDVYTYSTKKPLVTILALDNCDTILLISDEKLLKGCSIFDRSEEYYKKLLNLYDSNKYFLVGINKHDSTVFIRGMDLPNGDPEYVYIKDLDFNFIKNILGEGKLRCKCTVLPWESCDGLSEIDVQSILAELSPISFEDIINQPQQKESNKTKGEKTMNMPNINFEFGPCGEDIAMSPYGVAIRDTENDKWMVYNPATEQTVDVTGFVFKFNKMIYKIPTAIAALNPGDVIMHKNKPMFVTFVNKSDIAVVDLTQSERKTIIPITNIFNFNYIIKVVPIIDMNSMGTPSPDQPFGNIMPIMIMSEMFGDKDENGEDNFFGDMDMGKLMMFSMMTGQQNPFASMFNFGSPQVNPTNPQ